MVTNSRIHQFLRQMLSPCTCSESAGAGPGAEVEKPGDSAGGTGLSLPVSSAVQEMTVGTVKPLSHGIRKHMRCKDNL